MANESPSLSIETEELHTSGPDEAVESQNEYSPSVEMRQLKKMLDKADAEMEAVKLKLRHALELPEVTENDGVENGVSASRELNEIIKQKENDPLESIKLLNILKIRIQKTRDQLSSDFLDLSTKKNKLEDEDIADANWQVKQNNDAGWFERIISFRQAGRDIERLDKLREVVEETRREMKDKEYELNRLKGTLEKLEESLTSAHYTVYKNALPGLVNEYKEFASKAFKNLSVAGELYEKSKDIFTVQSTGGLSKILGALIASKFKKFVDEVHLDKKESSHEISQINSQLKELLAKPYDDLNRESRNWFAPDENVFWSVSEIQEIKHAPRLQYLANDGIKFIDNTLSRLTKSYMLSDSEGRSIQCAKYYPDPEIIRNLAYLSCAEPNGHRHQHVGIVLEKLSQREDWPQLLDEAERVYPELENIRDELINWNLSANWQTRDAKLKAALKDGALKITQKKQGHRFGYSDIEFVAYQVLPNLTLFELLAEKKIVEPEVGARVEEAIQNLKKREEVVLEDLSLNSKTRLSGWNFGSNLRNALLRCLRSPYDKEELYLNSLVKIAEEVNRLYKEDEANVGADETKAKEADYKVNYIISDEVAGLAYASPNELPNILTAYKDCPTLLHNPELRKVFVGQFSYYNNQEKLKKIQELADLIGDKNENLPKVCELIAKNSLSIDLILNLDQRFVSALKSPLAGVLLAFTDVFLKDEESLALFEKSSVLYLDYKNEYHNIVFAILNGNLKRELLCEIPKYMKLLLTTGEESSKNEMAFILSHGNVLIEDISDLQFINTFFGTYGGRAYSLLKGYHECIKAGVITLAEKQIVFEFLKEIKSLSPGILKGYIEAKEAGIVETYSTLLRQTSEKMISQKSCTKDEMEKPYYNDLLRHVYAQNSGQWGSFEGNKNCEDRSVDLEQYKFKSRYALDLFAANDVRVKSGMEIDNEKIATVQAPIYNIEKKFKGVEYDNKKVLEDVDLNLEKQFAEISTRRGWEGKRFTREEKLFAIMLQSVFGGQSVEVTKELLLQYEFASFEDVRDYIAGTNDRVAAAPNKEYALLCELNTFYADRVKEVNRLIAQKSYENPDIKGLVKDHFTELAKRKAAEKKLVDINKLQVDKLGLTEGFIKQIGKTLKKRTGKTYTDKQVRRIVGLYEKITAGLSGESISDDKGTQAFFGQLKAQRGKSILALEKITGEAIDPKSIQLGNIDFQSVLTAEASVKDGVYNEEAFMAYTVDRMIKLFEGEREAVGVELSKFESSTGKKRQVLNAVITKSKESSNARMVGGVCVAGDNPPSEKNMWESSNYIQMVFQDPESLQCQGLVLMHVYEEEGKKILTASINPSSTYLYSVDEKTLCKKIIETIGEFAKENDIDVVTTSQNKAIRTNRTGGVFENQLDKHISEIGKTFTFKEPQTFSYRPAYSQQEMDVIWQKAV